MTPGRIPVFVLTGFLGSGKTTLLRFLLAHPGMRDTVVVINELGEVGLDHLLVREVTEEVVLLGSGCVCCAVRDDLVASLRELRALRAAGAIPAYARAVVETTGLADPAPLVQTLMSDPALTPDYRLASLVATVDGVLGEKTLDGHMEAVKQAAMADRLVLSKADLASPAQLARLRERLGALNPAAQQLVSAPGTFPSPEALFDARAIEREARGWIGEAAYLERDAASGRGAAARHDARVAAFCIRIAEPLAWTPFREWLELLAASRGESLLRVKGLVNFAGRSGPVVIQGVQHMFYPPETLARWPDEDRTTRLVFITRDLTRTAVETSLRDVLGASLALA